MEHLCQLGPCQESARRGPQREAGSFEKFDAARKVFREAESHLLNRVAAGSPRAFQQLDMLRKSPLGFSPTVFEGVALDYGPRGARHSGYMNRRGDFPLQPGRNDTEPYYHPALLGYRPCVVASPSIIPATPPSTERALVSSRGTARPRDAWSSRETPRETPCEIPRETSHKKPLSYRPSSASSQTHCTLTQGPFSNVHSAKPCRSKFSRAKGLEMVNSKH